MDLSANKKKVIASIVIGVILAALGLTTGCNNEVLCPYMTSLTIFGTLIIFVVVYCVSYFLISLFQKKK